MHARKIRWLAYTVLVGLIPICSRFFVWMVARTGTVDAVAAVDFVAFGLVLHIATINELAHVSGMNPSWRTLQSGMAVFFVAVYSVLYATSLVGDKIVDARRLTYCATTMALVSFLLNLSVFARLDKASQEES